MPKLAQFRQYHYDATVRVSENTRTLAIAAIGVVWIFKQNSGPTYTVPESLMLPLLLVVAALALDFAQHLYRSIAWHIIFRSKENDLDKGVSEETELYVCKWTNTPAYVFFYLKVPCLGYAYWKLIHYFYHAVKWV